MKFAALLLVAASACAAQMIQLGKPPAAKHGEVQLLTDSANVKAGAADEVELRFRVTPGLHINSHTPGDELLIPTVATFQKSAKIEAFDPAYPASERIHLKVGEGADMNVYTGEFRVRVKVKAAAGNQQLDGELRYQACDAASCFPPRSLPIHVAVQAR